VEVCNIGYIRNRSVVKHCRCQKFTDLVERNTPSASNVLLTISLQEILSVLEGHEKLPVSVVFLLKMQ